MPAVLVYQRCQGQFDAKRSDVLWCPECREIRRKEYQRDYDGDRKDNCPICGASKGIRATYCKPCDNRERRTRHVGEGNPNWKQGRSVDGGGYIVVRTKVGSPGKGKGGYYTAQHRLVWEQSHGQPIPKGFVVHHLNGIKTDNRPENLVAMSRHYHHHHPREALRPYETRIAALEEYIRSIGHEPPVGELPEVDENHSHLVPGKPPGER